MSDLDAYMRRAYEIIEDQQRAYSKLLDEQRVAYTKLIDDAFQLGLRRGLLIGFATSALLSSIYLLGAR